MRYDAQGSAPSTDLIFNLPPLVVSGLIAAAVALLVAVITNVWQGRRERARDEAQRQDQRERDREQREDQRRRDAEQREDQRERDRLQREDQRRRDDEAIAREDRNRFATQKREMYADFMHALDAYVEAVFRALDWYETNRPSAREEGESDVGEGDGEEPDARRDPGWLVHERARTKYETPVEQKWQELRLFAPSDVTKLAGDCLFRLSAAMIAMRFGSTHEDAFTKADIDRRALIQAMRRDLGADPEDDA